MAHFRGTITGNRGQASRLGTKNSDLSVTCNGWECGISVYAHYNTKTNRDEFRVILTGGSGDLIGHKDLGTFTEYDLTRQ